HFDTGPGQSGGRVTASKRRIPEQSSILGGAHTRTSRRHTAEGTQPVTSSIIRRRYPACLGRSALPWKTFQVRTTSCIASPAAEATGTVGDPRRRPAASPLPPPL